MKQENEAFVTVTRTTLALPEWRNAPTAQVARWINWEQWWRWRSPPPLTQGKWLSTAA